MSSDIGIYGEELYEQVLPLHGPDPDGLLHDLIGAYVHGALEIDDLARDDAQGRPGWGVILDVDECPVKGLPWLGQIAGVTLRDPKTITLYNEIADSSAEFANLTAWSPFHCTVAAIPGGVSGDKMVRATVTTNGTAVITFTLACDPFQNVAAGIDIIATSRAMHVDLEFQGDAFATLTHITGPSSTDTGRRSIVARAPAGTLYMLLSVNVPSSVVGETFDLDAASLVRGALTDIYFDGFSPGGSFLDTASPQFSASAFTRLESDDEWAAYARDAIRRQGGKGRGTADAMLSAAEDTLTGTRSGRIIERAGGNAYALELITRPSETPDPDATLAAAMTQKPAGMSLIHTLTEGAVIDEGTVSIDTATGQIDTATIDDIT